MALCISVSTLSELFCKSEIISRFKVKRKTFLVPVLAKTKPRALLFADTLILGIFLMTRGMPSFSRRIPRLYYILKHFILNTDTSNLRLVNFQGSNCLYKHFQCYTCLLPLSLSHSLFHHLFYFCRIGCNVPTFISDLSNLSLCFILVHLAKGLPTLLILSQNQLLVSLIFSFCCCSLFHLTLL